MKYVLSLDAGTTSNRAIVYDARGEIVSISQRDFQQYYPQPGYVEHDATAIWETMLDCMRDALMKANLTASDISAIGITNQRETVVVWDALTLSPVCPAIVWQCRRTAAYCDELRARGLAKPIREKTGLVLDAYFSGTKLKWILDNVPNARVRAERGELLFGTVDSWLIAKLTLGRVHATDYSNASRTMLYNIHTLAYDEDMLREFAIPRRMLPEVRPSSGVFGMADKSLLGAEIPIAGVAGDQQSALFGQCAFASGMAKNTYGTGCFLLMNTGTIPVESKHDLITTIAWGEGGRVEYALEGSVFVAGACVQWLRDELHMIGSAAESEALASSVEDTNGCVLVPAFVGLGAPYWDAYVRGSIFGLTRGVNRAHMVRAALESIAYQVTDVVRAMEEDMGARLGELRVDGGASANGFLMRFQSDIINAPVIRPKSVETTSRGAAYLAGLATGVWETKEELLALSSDETRFTPAMEEAKRAALLTRWHKAVAAARAFWE